MSRMVVNTAVVVGALLAGLGLARAQQPGGPPPQKGKAVEPPAKPAPLPLEDMLAKALKDNPDIRVAEAKLREAEAELNRTRLQVMQKVILCQQTLKTQQSLVQEMQTQVDHMRKLWKVGQAPATGVQAAEQTLISAKAKLAEMETQLPYLLGKQALAGKHVDWVHSVAFSPDGRLLTSVGKDSVVRVWDAVSGKEVKLWDVAAKPEGTMAEKIRKALETPVKVDFQGTPVVEILRYLQEHTKGVNFQIAYKFPDSNVNLSLTEKVPLGSALQALEDAFPDMIFVVRDYGILVTNRSTLPPNPLPVHDFWKHALGKASSAPPKK